MNSNTPNAHYDVMQGEPLVARSHIGQVVRAGRTPDGDVVLLLSPYAAEQLAKNLSHYDMPCLCGNRDKVDGYDTDLWGHHVPLGLQMATALSLHAADAAAKVVHVPFGEPK
ncbi:hypothetical protein Back2_17560 [Nocardioides baekrokdamisoli]|uniref:Uncharacterized protein n=1 Tax=Nocardioides baekrokdamisoli TaxID=1804624 RepID=A0A3G9J392_9ACTN|nr:hypothetical protein [Nocardioides baekrokdamisoli]BBH17469.1 hypothetical protein Back2_17560 [Nocardioides baekrokdamisoli]